MSTIIFPPSVTSGKVLVLLLLSVKTTKILDAQSTSKYKILLWRHNNNNNKTLLAFDKISKFYGKPKFKIWSKVAIYFCANSIKHCRRVAGAVIRDLSKLCEMKFWISQYKDERNFHLLQINIDWNPIWFHLVIQNISKYIKSGNGKKIGTGEKHTGREENILGN